MLPVNYPFHHQIKIGRTIKGLGKIEDIYEQQIQINGQWYHRRCVFEHLCTYVSFDKLKETVHSDDLDIVSVAKDYVVNRTSAPDFNVMERFGAKHTHGLFSKLVWLRANLTTAYSELLSITQ